MSPHLPHAEELHFSYSRSSGPGGQNVNKVNSRVSLRWNPSESKSIPVDVKQRFLQRFASKLTKTGDLLVHSDERRDQGRNLEACLQKLEEMLAEVWRAPKKRIPTKPSRAQKEQRLSEKKRRSEHKKNRQLKW